MISTHIRALVSQFEYIFIFFLLNCLREIVSDSKQFLWEKTWAPKNYCFTLQAHIMHEMT